MNVIHLRYIFCDQSIMQPFRVQNKQTELHYKLMRQNHNLEYYNRMCAKWHGFNHARYTIWEAFEALGAYRDTSDPDTELPNLMHMLQSAEAARAAGEPDWLQVTALIHDMGKIMYLWGDTSDGQANRLEVGHANSLSDYAQWGLGGDTWVLGLPLPANAVCPQYHYDNTADIIQYKRGCGMHNLYCTYGHDEYMYAMLKHNGCTLPEEALYCVRFHSLYPWHGDSATYADYECDIDRIAKVWVKKFNQYDLYSKRDKSYDIESLKSYYNRLLEKYNLHGTLSW